MKLPYEEKVRLAENLRLRSSQRQTAPSERDPLFAQCSLQTKVVETREGPSKIVEIVPVGSGTHLPVLFNLHGGGFVLNREQSDLAFCCLAAKTFGCAVVDIEYKLAPEHPFPAALNECYDIIKGFTDNSNLLGVVPGKFVVCGFDSGGTLAAAVALMANQTKEFALCGQIIVHPFFDPIAELSKEAEPGDVSAIERLRLFKSLYIDDDEDRDNPFVSLTHARREMLCGLPPVLIIVSDFDDLSTEAGKYAAMLVDAGVEVLKERYSKYRFPVAVRGIGECAMAHETVFNALGRFFGMKRDQVIPLFSGHI